MKNLRAIIAFAFLLVCTPAFAQWQTSNHSIPIGRGGGVTGFGAVAPGTSGIPLIGQGSSADPAYGPIVNGGITAGAADTYKGSLNGSTVTDIPRAPCTGATQALRYTAGVGESCGIVAVQLGYDMPVNLQLNATVNSNQLIIAVKGINGLDPSSINPVQINFRDTTATGTLVTGSLQSALSFTLATTSSLGCITATTCRIWVEFICQTVAGGACTSILVGASAQSSTTSGVCLPIDESSLQATGSGTTGGTSLGTIYTSVATLSNKQIRIGGYIEAVWTSGTGWASPSNMQLFGPGVKKPCDVVTTKYTSGATPTGVGSGPTATVPSISITPISKANLIRATAMGQVEQSGGSSAYTYAVIYRTTGGSPACTTQVGVVQSTPGGAGGNNPVALRAFDAPQTISQITYVVCAGGNAGTYCPNLIGNSCDIQVEEIMGKLEREPANDDARLARTG